MHAHVRLFVWELDCIHAVRSPAALQLHPCRAVARLLVCSGVELLLGCCWILGNSVVELLLGCCWVGVGWLDRCCCCCCCCCCCHSVGLLSVFSRAVARPTCSLASVRPPSPFFAWPWMCNARFVKRTNSTVHFVVTRVAVARPIVPTQPRTVPKGPGLKLAPEIKANYSGRSILRPIDGAVGPGQWGGH